jgi:hypothetical protein
MAKWLETFIDQTGNGSDFNDSYEVLGWLGATLQDDTPGNYVLTVTHETDGGLDKNVKTVEHYRVTSF